MANPKRHRNFINHGLLRFLSFFCIAGGVGLLSTVLFNFRPHSNVISDWYSYLDFSKGIPVEARTNLKIADTSIVTYDKYSANRVSNKPGAGDKPESVSYKASTFPGTDSLFTQKKLYTRKGEVVNDVTVTAIHMNRAKLFLESEKLSHRLYFSLPGIVTFFVAAFCLSMLASLVSDIQEGSSFGKINRIRLQKIGWALLLLQGVFLIMNVTSLLFGKFNISFTGTLPDYPSHFDFQATPVMPFSPAWILIGTLVLILAYAFRDGEILQEDKDLIV